MDRYMDAGGLMGALADAVLAARGHVTGVIPEALVAKEVAHDGLSDLRVVGAMQRYLQPRRRAA
jgi:predicted Rossmann-fold nucleotide-binding protein